MKLLITALCQIIRVIVKKDSMKFKTRVNAVLAIIRARIVTVLLKATAPLVMSQMNLTEFWLMEANVLVFQDTTISRTINLVYLAIIHAVTVMDLI
jgi:hypothetical protein